MEATSKATHPRNLIRSTEGDILVLVVTSSRISGPVSNINQVLVLLLKPVGLRPDTYRHGLIHRKAQGITSGLSLLGVLQQDLPLW